MTDNRPKNLNLFAFHFPIPAIMSILHRVSGVIMVVLLPGLFWLLQQSLTPKGFKFLKDGLNNVCVKLVVFAVLAAVIYHICAGIRHLISDAGFGDSLKGGRMSAWLTLLAAVVLVVLVGIWLW